MIIINNFITLCKYILYKTIGITGVKYIEYDPVYSSDDDSDVSSVDDEDLCGCNLCYTFGNIVFFATRHLQSKKM